MKYFNQEMFVQMMLIFELPLTHFRLRSTAFLNRTAEESSNFLIVYKLWKESLYGKTFQLCRPELVVVKAILLGFSSLKYPGRYFVTRTCLDMEENIQYYCFPLLQAQHSWISNINHSSKDIFGNARRRTRLNDINIEFGD